MKNRKVSRLILIVIVVAVVVAQIVPVTRDNPPIQADFNASPAVNQVLKKSCYDCHSNETVWPWYSYVAPVSWLVAGDVHDARKMLNFSNWGILPEQKIKRAPLNMWDEVDQGGMPLPMYLLMHRDARLTDADKAVIQAWAEGGTPADTITDTTHPSDTTQPSGEPEEESQ